MKRCRPAACAAISFPGRLNAIQIDLFRLTFIALGGKLLREQVNFVTKAKCERRSKAATGPLSTGEGRRAIIVIAALTGLFSLATFVIARSFLSTDPQAMSSVSKVARSPGPKDAKPQAA